MALEARAECAQCQALRKRKVARMRHRGVAHGADVTVGEDKPIALFPCRILRVVIKDVEVQCGNNVRHAKRTRGVPRAGRNEHFHDCGADVRRF